MVVYCETAAKLKLECNSLTYKKVYVNNVLKSMKQRRDLGRQGKNAPDVIFD